MAKAAAVNDDEGEGPAEGTVTAETLAKERREQVKAVLAAAVEQKPSSIDGLAFLQEQVPLNNSTASAYAFLATVSKDQGAANLYSRKRLGLKRTRNVV